MENNENNLEEFLRGHLENYGAAANGWNVPPDELWEAVRPKVVGDVPKSRFMGYGKWLPLLLAIGGIIFIAIFQSVLYLQEIDQLSVEIDSLKKELSLVSDQVNRSELGALPFTTSKKALTTAPPDNREVSGANLISPYINEEERINLTEAKKELATATAGYPSVRSSEVMIQEKQSGTETLAKLALSKEQVSVPNASISPVELKKYADLKDVATLPAGALPELKYSDTFAIANKVKEVKKLVSGHPSLNVALGRMFVDRFLDTIPEKFENYVSHQYTGLSLGINLEWPLSPKWYLETGINYQHFSAESHHHRHFSYSDAQEDIPGLGSDDFQIRKRFHSAIGHAQTTLTMTHGQLRPSPSEQLDISLDSDTHAHYLGIPLGLKYRIKMGSLGVFLRGGILGSIRAHQKFEVKHLVVHQTDIIFKYSEHTEHIEDVKKFHLQYLIGGGFDYQISPHYALQLGSTFSRSLSPLTNIEGVKIGLEAVTIRGGLKLFF